MNKGLLAILFCVFGLYSLTVQGQADTLLPIEYYFQNGNTSGKGFLLNGIPHSKWSNYFESGKLKSSGNFSQGKTDGIWIFYSDSGFVKQSVEYRFGKKEGEKKLFDSKGNLLFKESFRNDIKEGWSESYFESGAIKARIPFKEGKEEGRGVEYDQSGIFLTLMDYRAGALLRMSRVNRLDRLNRKTGNWIETDSVFNIIRETQYSEGLKNGYLKEYDVHGNLSKIEKYINDVLQEDAAELRKVALSKTYFSGGQIKSQGAFLDGKPIGIHTTYSESGLPSKASVYENGLLIGFGSLDELGRKTGLWTELYNEGEKKSEGNYLAGVKVGNWKYFFRNSEIEQVGSYNNGLQEGIWKWFYEDGKLLREEEFRKGKEDGFSYELDRNEDTLSSGEYIDGLREGPWYFRDGDQVIHGNFLAGEMSGLWTHIYEKGGVKFKGFFVEGLADGKHQSWYPDGTLFWEGKYNRGLKQGSWVKYTSEGVPIIDIYFEDGIERKYDGFNVFPDFSPADFESLIQKNPYIF